MAEKEILQELGLSEAEAKVYLTLLEVGSTLAGPVIKKTGLHRGTTYQILQRLKEKGLVSSVIKEKENALVQILPALKSKMQGSKDKQDVTVYSGSKGIHSVLDKMMEELI